VAAEQATKLKHVLDVRNPPKELWKETMRTYPKGLELILVDKGMIGPLSSTRQATSDTMLEK
jgi:hypothetical protein